MTIYLVPSTYIQHQGEKRC